MPRNVRVIARRELASYFDSPVAYIVLMSFLLAAGWMFFSTLFLLGRADLRGFFSPSPFSPSMLLVVLAPAITMRLLADEKKSGTFELMTTMPIRDSEWVLGKFVAAWGLLAIGLSTTLLYAVSVATLGELDWGPVITGYAGFLLFAGSLVGIGLLASALTNKQIVAFIAAFLVSAGLYFLFWLQFFVPQSVAAVLEYISLSYHLDNMARGVIDSRDLTFYLSVIVGTLFLTVRSVARQHA